MAVTGAFRVVARTPPIYEELRQRLDLRDKLVHFRVQQTNRRHAVQGRLALPALQAHRNEVIEGLEKKTKALEKEMKTILLRDKEWGKTARYLFSIKGLGVYTVVALITLTLNFTLIESSEQLAAFIGVVPRKDDSGKREREFIGFSNVPHLRAALYIAVTSAIRFNPIIASYYRRQLRKHKGKKSARIACINKLLKIGWGCVVNQTKFDPNHHLPALPSEATND